MVQVARTNPYHTDYVKLPENTINNVGAAWESATGGQYADHNAEHPTRRTGTHAQPAERWTAYILIYIDTHSVGSHAKACTVRVSSTLRTNMSTILSSSSVVTTYAGDNRQWSPFVPSKFAQPPKAMITRPFEKQRSWTRRANCFPLKSYCLVSGESKSNSMPQNNLMRRLNLARILFRTRTGSYPPPRMSNVTGAVIELGASSRFVSREYRYSPRDRHRSNSPSALMTF